MSGQFKGMVVEDVEQLGNLLIHQVADQINQIVQQVNSKLHSTNWVGDDRMQFENDWQGQYMNQLNHVRDALGTFGQHALSEANQQREASHS